MGSAMERVPVNGAELEVDAQGSGEWVVFVHGAGVTALEAEATETRPGETTC